MKALFVSLILAAAAPVLAAPGPSSQAAAALSGSWSWTCCKGRHSGTFRIGAVAASGAFRGKFGSSPSEGNSPLAGRLVGDRLSFTRTILVNGKRVGEQQWTARLVRSDGRWQMVQGDWSGYARAAGNGGFSASKTAGPATPAADEPAAERSALSGSWSWTCCKERHSGTFRIGAVDASGAFRGKFGSSPSEGNSPLAGRLAGDRLSFTRTILVNGKRVGEQQWTARLVRSGGRWQMVQGDWSGYARAADNGGFSASKPR